MSSSSDIVFIVGIPRSGTTWLLSILEGHPDCQALVPGMLDIAVKNPTKETGLFVRGYSDADILHRVAEASRRYTGKILVEKTPSHMLALPRIKRLFPKSKIIHIRRNPLDVLFSMVQENRFWENSPKSLDEALELYVRFAQCESAFDAFDYSLRYEDLWENPVAEAERLFSFLGLERSHAERIIARTRFGRSLPVALKTVFREGTPHQGAPGFGREKALIVREHLRAAGLDDGTPHLSAGGGEPHTIEAAAAPSPHAPIQGRDSAGRPNRSLQPRALHVLLSNIQLVSLTGSEIFTFTLADYLRRCGHQVSVYAKFLGEYAGRFRDIGVSVTDDIKRLQGLAFDIAHVHHNITAYEIRNAFPELPMVFLSHGVLPFLEQPPVLDLNIHRYLAVSEEVGENLMAKGIDSARIDLVPNLVDPDRFYEIRPVRQTPRSACVLSYKMAPEVKSLVVQACHRSGIAEVEFAGGSGAWRTQEELVQFLNRADVVFSLGRGVIEAMFCGRIPIVFDNMGGDGLVTPDNFATLARSNFSGRHHRKAFSDEDLAAEIGRYTPSHAPLLQRMARARYGADRQIQPLLDLYRRTITEASRTPSVAATPPFEAFVQTIQETQTRTTNHLKYHARPGFMPTASAPDVHRPSNRRNALPADFGETSNSDAVKAIAFYLPQYHPVPENDRWWGQGFTEWTNVAKARPLFAGHYQPHLPGDLGFYDLRLKETRLAQAAMAKAHGLFGFCYYHYWFHGRRLLDRPFQEVLAQGEPDFPFCLCWANEDWTRAWDGRSGETLLQQTYSPEDDRRHIQWLLKAFRDPRYIRVNGRPLMLIYRANRMPDPAATTALWREESRRAGFPDLYICRVESFADEHSPPASVDCDAAVEFQPDWRVLGSLARDPAVIGHRVYDYASVAEKMMRRDPPPFKQLPCVVPMWDNSPRRETDAVIFSNSTPEVYGRWLAHSARRALSLPAGERLVFINAWNEWGEGNHLEPDRRHGHGYLVATQTALASLRGPEARDELPPPSEGATVPMDMTQIYDCLATDRFADARAGLESILAHRPDSIEALNALAVVECHDGNLDAGFSVLNRVFELDPANPAATQNTNLLLADLSQEAECHSDDRQDVIRHFNRMVRIASFERREDYLEYFRQTQDRFRERQEHRRRLVGNQRRFETFGYCFVCRRRVGFTVDFRSAPQVHGGRREPHWRERVVCPHCHLNSRMRLQYQMLDQLIAPSAATPIFITEQTTSFFKLLKSRFAQAVGSEFLGSELASGQVNDKGIRNENLLKTSFPDKAFGLVLSFDVFEHLPVPGFEEAFRECHRILSDDGILLFTVPFHHLGDRNIIRADHDAHGRLRHRRRPAYHGNPVDPRGSLAYQDFSWPIVDQLKAAGFDRIRAHFAWSPEMGYLSHEFPIFTAVKNPAKALHFDRFSDDCHLIPISASGSRALDRSHVGTQAHEPMPQVSIVIPVFNGLDHTRNCLDAIEQHPPGIPHEVIVVDNGSSDGTRAFLDGRGGTLRLLTNDQNLGFTEACNRGAEAARAPFLVFLNNDTIPRPGWLEHLLHSAEEEERVGAVGAKLIYPDGRLQEAGGVVLSDGSTRNFGRGDDPTRADYCRPCEVDYCSGACLLVRTDLFRLLGGFDRRYSPAYYEETDLCFRLRELGYRALYCPQAEVVHVGSATAGTDIHTGFRRFLALNRTKFVARWKEVLVRHEPPPGPGQSIHTSDRRLIGLRTSILSASLPLEAKVALPSPEEDARLPERLLAAAHALLEQGREPEALAALQDLTGFAPEMAVAHNDLGVLHAQRGEWTPAVENYEAALALEPGNVTFRKNLGELQWLALQDPGAALPHYLKVLEQVPDDAEALFALGQISAVTGHPDDAGFFFRRLLGQQPDHRPALEALAELSPAKGCSEEGDKPPQRFEKHAPIRRPPNEAAPTYPARIAVVSSRVPQHDRSSADNRIRHLVQMMRAGGAKVLFLHASPGSQTPAYIEGLGAGTALQALPLEARHFEQALTEFAPDCVWFTNLWHLPYVEMVADLVEALKRDTTLRCIVDTMDFHYKKYMRKYHRSQMPEDLSTAMHFWRLERKLYASADLAVTVTATDAADIQRALAGCAPLQVVPNVHPSVFSTTPWEQRDHVCFLGNFAVNHNRDAAQEFACRVLPILRARRAGTEFHLLGPGSEDLAAELAVEGLKGRGFVADLPQALSRYRVFGCALTYGSGMKGKIGEAAAAGLPVVSTPMGLEGFPLTAGEDCLQAETAADLADACLRLLEDRTLWDRMRRRASATLELHFSPARVEASLRQVLAPLPAPRPADLPSLPVVTESAGPRSLQTDLAQRLLAKGWADKYARYAPLVASVDRRPPAAKPALSVVVVTWRYQPDTLECLKRLEKERERGYELILVDNGCPEGALEALHPYADIRVRLRSNTGACVARNIGAVYAQTPLLLFLDDDALPAEHLIAAHLYTQQRYDVIAVRGACRPRSAGNWFNSKAQHYYLGDRPFPRFADIEGNTSYRSEPFFACGGWDDDLFFGHEGAVLALRLWRQDPEWRRQIYSPDPVIAHDFAHNADHMQTKGARQRESLQRILQAYPDYLGFLDSWKRWHLQRDVVLPRPQADEDQSPRLPSRIEARPQDTLVSIVIPTHNRAELLQQAVESALSQSYRNAEILVVDDASDDGTREVVAAISDERVRYLPKAHSGAPDTRNTGIAAARGSYILWLDDDDLLLPGALESQVRMVQSHPDTDVAYGPHEKFEHGTGREVGLLDPRDWSLEPRLLLNALLGACPIPNPGTMVRRSVYQDLGPYDLNFHRAHDYEFWSRAAERLVFRKTHHILCRYRIHGTNMSVGRTIDQSYESVIVRRMLARYGYQRLFPFLDWDRADAAESVARFLTAERLFALNDYYNAQHQLALVPKAHQTMEMLELQLRCAAYGKGRKALLTALDQAKDHPRVVPERLDALRQGFETYFDRLHMADRALRRKDFHQAMEHLEHIAALDHPPSSETLLKGGRLHIHAGDVGRAFKLIRKAVQTDPHDLRFAEACRLVQDCQQRRLLAETRQRILDPASPAAVKDQTAFAAPPSRQERTAPQPLPVTPEMSVVVPLDRVDARTLRYLRQAAQELDAAEVLLVLRKGRSDPGHEGRLRQAVPGVRILEVAGAASSVPSMNAGLASARGRLRVWLAPELMGSPDWRLRLLEAHGRAADAGPVGPVSPAFDGLQRAAAPMNHSSAAPEEGSGAALVHRHRRLPLERLDHRCFMLDRELLCKLGPMDEAYRSGAWALHDYCMRAWASGFVPLVVGDALVLPSPLAPSSAKRSAPSGLDEKDRRRFRSRWLAVPRPENSTDRPGALNLLRQLEEALHLDRPETVASLLAALAQIATPHFPLLRPLLAMLHRHGHTEAAVQWLAQAVPAWQDPLPLGMQALALAGAGDFGAARRLALGVLADAPHLAMAHDALGIIAFQEQNRGEAEQHFLRAAACDPGYAPAWAHLATLKWEEGSTSEALDLFERAFALDPLLPDVAADFGAAAKAAGFSARALSGLEEARRLYPRNKRLHFQHIELLLENEQWLEALRQIGGAAALHGASDGLLDAAMGVRSRIAPEDPPSLRPSRRPKVSLCMITRDEQRHLAACLHSVRALVDEIIVVDTVSQDRTRDIARLFDATVLEFPWQEDFAAARNFGLDHATGQVVLVLDADELIAPQDHDRLQALLRRPAALTTAYRVVTRNYTPLCNLIGWQANEGQYPIEEMGTGWTPSEKVRIFPNRPRIRFSYPVHEVVGPALEREGIAIASCEVPVHHYGRMDEALNRRKGEAYYQMGIQKLQELGSDPGAIQELAVQAELLGKTDEAVSLWQRLLELNPASVRAWLNLSTAFGRLGRFAQAARAATQALALDPSLKEAAFNHAMALLFQNQPEAAAAVLGDLLRRESDYYAARFLCAAAWICAGRRPEGLGILQALRSSGLWEVLPLSFDDLARRLENANLPHFSTALRQACSSLGQHRSGDGLAEDLTASAA